MAGGILPQSAIVTGFPDGVVERNRDAYLLSPATLLDRSLGRRVAHPPHLARDRRRRRDRGGDPKLAPMAASSFETPGGVEALRCTGLPEALVYDGVPPGLSARPTLSVRTRTAAPVTATVTLSYLAGGFDWQANYVAQLAPDGTQHRPVRLADPGEHRRDQLRQRRHPGGGGPGQSRGGRASQPREGGPINLQCWPQATTSDIPREQFQRMAQRPRVHGRRRGCRRHRHPDSARA